MALTLKNLINYVFARDGKDVKATENPLTYVVAKNGPMKVIKNDLGAFVKPVKEIPKLEEVKPGVFLDIPKIPFDVFRQQLAWFKAVYKKDKTESTIMVFYNKATNSFLLWAPKQANTTASSRYKRDEDPDYTQMCKDYTLVMVNHSHPWPGGTSVHPSGIDDNDEKEAMLYMVVGNVEGTPNVFVSTCPDGDRMQLSFFDIYENPLDTLEMPQEYKDLLKEFMPEREVMRKFSSTEGIDVPAEWWNQIVKYVAPPATNVKVYDYTVGRGSHASRASRASMTENEEAEAERRARAYYSSCYGSSLGTDADDWTDDEIDAYWGAYVGTTKAPTSVMSPPNHNFDFDDDGLVIEKFDSEIDRLTCGASYSNDRRTKDSEFSTLGDVIDGALNLSDAKMSQFLYILVEEGYGDVMQDILDDKESIRKSGLKGVTAASEKKHGKGQKKDTKGQDGRTEGRTIIDTFNKFVEKGKAESKAADKEEFSGLKSAPEQQVKLTICLGSEKKDSVALKLKDDIKLTEKN